jgi:hypothetical protein
MRDETIIGGFKSLEQRLGQVIQFIQGLQQAIRLDSTGKEIRLLAIQQLLIKKGHLTEAEMTEQSGLVIQQMQKEAEEAAAKAAAPAIVPATPEQTAQVAAAPATDEAVKEAVAPVVPPPQA